MQKKQYDRQQAVDYAHKWAFGRNPKYYDFELLNGDCTNFISQILYAGGAVMNDTPTFGWYYYNINNRAPAWTGVEYLYNFLVKNQSVGPVAIDTTISNMQQGDIIQLSFDGIVFRHSLAVVEVGQIPSLSNILIATHSSDSDYRPLDTYYYHLIRFLHITHINIW